VAETWDLKGCVLRVKEKLWIQNKALPYIQIHTTRTIRFKEKNTTMQQCSGHDKI
jgi:hypothetical protein